MQHDAELQQSTLWIPAIFSGLHCQRVYRCILETIVQRRFSDINCDCSRSIVKQKTFRWIQIYLHSTERQAGQDVSINQMSIEKI